MMKEYIRGRKNVKRRPIWTEPKPHCILYGSEQARRFQTLGIEGEVEISERGDGEDDSC